MGRLEWRKAKRRPDERVALAWLIGLDFDSFPLVRYYTGPLKILFLEHLGVPELVYSEKIRYFPWDVDEILTLPRPKS